MTRRIQPPKHPATGHPYVDNALRNAWREYRSYLAKMGAYERDWVIFYGGNYAAEDSYFIAPPTEGSRMPRKLKKAFAKQTLAAAFIYFEPDYYTPKRALLEIANQNPTNKESK